MYAFLGDTSMHRIIGHDRGIFPDAAKYHGAYMLAKAVSTYALPPTLRLLNCSTPRLLDYEIIAPYTFLTAATMSVTS